MTFRFAAAAVLALAFVSVAEAAEFEIRMLNDGTKGAAVPLADSWRYRMVFDPDLVRIAPGDTVHFIATDKGHDVQSIEGMIPDGGQGFVGKISQDLTVTFTVPGVYGIKCDPHLAMGMVGLIVVGDPVNRKAAEAVKDALDIRLAKKRFDLLFGEL